MKPVKYAPLNLLHSVMNLLNPSLCNRNYSTRNLRSKRFLSPQHRVLQVPGFKQWELTRCQTFLLSSKYHQNTDIQLSLFIPSKHNHFLVFLHFLQFLLSGPLIPLRYCILYIPLFQYISLSDEDIPCHQSNKPVLQLSLFYAAKENSHDAARKFMSNISHTSLIQLPFAIRDYKFYFKATKCHKSGRRNGSWMWRIKHFSETCYARV